MTITYAPENRKPLVDYVVMAVFLACLFIAFEIRDFVYFRDRSGSANLNRLDKCNTGFFAEA
jgi:hypothetical protein